MTGSVSSAIIQAMNESLKKKEQVILFQNRRGYSPFIECPSCGYVPKCINCSVSLTYHQYKHSLICHYCGYHENLPNTCPSCSGNKLLTIGLGTEKLEEEIKLLFPEASVQRMDLDTTRTKSGYANIIQSFEEGATDILIGTQMVSKGLDFDKVNLVGVFDADRILHFPDFRSYERAFQLITQVSGRAGRREAQGKVLIQTYNPQHPIFKYIVQTDSVSFLETEIHDRRTNFYPPFSRLLLITIKHSDKRICFEAARCLGDKLKSMVNIRVMGPAEPIVSKIRNEYRQTILLKIPRSGINLSAMKLELLKKESELLSEKNYKRVSVIFDVDPN